MICAACRDRLLEAGRADIGHALAGGSGPCAAHLAECSECRDLAQRIVEMEEGLAAGMTSIQPGGRAVEAASAAIRESVRRRSRDRRRWGWLAAAAAVAGLVAIRTVDLRFEPPEQEVASLAPASASAAVGPEVEPLGDESVAVFTTDNPDIVVFWFYQGRGE